MLYTHQGGLKFKGSSKIISLEGSRCQEVFGVARAFIGAAGTANLIGDAWSFLLTGGKMPPVKDTEFLALLEGGTIKHSSNLKHWLLVDKSFYSIGSGSHFAIGSLSAGSTSDAAVLHASDHDIYTGLGVKTYWL